MMGLVGGVELGGTKTVFAVGRSDGELIDFQEIPTTSPDETLGRVVEHFSGFGLEAIGVASFGPLELRTDHVDYGTLLSTPKPGWEGASVSAPLQWALGVPVVVDTDVSGAALAEGRWGAAVGVDLHAYITVGTGIGVGIVSGGAPYRGMAHVEMGHVPVARADDDDFAGSCPFHVRCLEGMASGRALNDRFGRPAEDLTGSDLGRALELLGCYLGQGLRALAYTFAPERVVIGGGVSKTDGFFDAVHSGLLRSLGGYLELPLHAHPDYLVGPKLGDRSGVLGAIILATRAIG